MSKPDKGQLGVETQKWTLTRLFLNIFSETFLATRSSFFPQFFLQQKKE